MNTDTGVIGEIFKHFRFAGVCVSDSDFILQLRLAVRVEVNVHLMEVDFSR
jgi:hypothetical protein